MQWKQRNNQQHNTDEWYVLGDSGSNFVLISRVKGRFFLADVVVAAASVVVVVAAAAAAVVIAAAAAAAAWSFEVAVVWPTACWRGVSFSNGCSVVVVVDALMSVPDGFSGGTWSAIVFVGGGNALGRLFVTCRCVY